MIRMTLTSAVLSLYVLTFGAWTSVETCSFGCPGSYALLIDGCCAHMSGGGSTDARDSRHVTNHTLTCCPSEKDTMGMPETSRDTSCDPDEASCRCAFSSKNALHEPPALIRIARSYEYTDTLPIHTCESAFDERQVIAYDTTSLPVSQSLLHRSVVLIM